MINMYRKKAAVQKENFIPLLCLINENFGTYKILKSFQLANMTLV